jgi:hypothetical protein
METVINDGISNVIVYIDDLLVHLATHEEHLATLGQVLKPLVQHKIKIYKSAFLEAKKCHTLASASLKKALNRALSN